MPSIQKLHDRVTFLENNYSKFSKSQAKKEYQFVIDTLKKLGNSNALGTKAVAHRIQHWLSCSLQDQKKPNKKVSFEEYFSHGNEITRHVR